MECKMSLVRALDMAALSVKCSALSMVYNGVSAIHRFRATGSAHTRCEPQ